MMLCVDGADIESLVCALAQREGDELRVTSQEVFARRLGHELSVVEDFLAGAHVAIGDVSLFGLVCGPGSAGALRSTLSLVNAIALAAEKQVVAVERNGEAWRVVAGEKPYVLPVYDRPVHTTPSQKDALGRRV